MTDVDEHEGLTFNQMVVGIAIERAIHDTGRCVCGRRPTLGYRIKNALHRLTMP